MRLARRFSLALPLVVAGILSSSLVDAGAVESPPERAQQLQDRAEVLRAEVGTVRAEVLRLRAAVEAQEAAAARAIEAKEAAGEALSEARRARADARQAAVDQGARVRRLAAAAYIHGPAAIEAVLQSPTVNDAVRRHSMATAAGDASTKVLEDLRRAEEAAERSEAAHDAAATDATAAAEAALTEAAVLERDMQRQTALLSSVSSRLEHNLSEAAALRQIDEEAAAAIADADAELAGVVPPPRPRPPVAIPSLVRQPPSVPTVRIGSIRVADTISSQVEALLAAASAAGLRLGGGGYRDPAQQVALRIAHCGPTDFDVYEKPSNECTPPTARPGTSMHERGLAIDFTFEGRAIASEDHPVFQWLAANAAAYGLSNLAGEPWHWSTTGN